MDLCSEGLGNTYHARRYSLSSEFVPIEQPAPISHAAGTDLSASHTGPAISADSRLQSVLTNKTMSKRLAAQARALLRRLKL